MLKRFVCSQLSMSQRPITTVVNSTITHGDENGCRARVTCAQCVSTSTCAWFYQNQTCVDTKTPLDPTYRIDNASSCPKYLTTVHHNLEKGSAITVVTVNLTGGTNELFGALRASPIECWLDGTTVGITVTDSDVIQCHLSRERSRHTACDPKSDKPYVSYFVMIKINGVQLRFDDESEHYAIDRCSDDCATDCVHCFWADGAHSYHCRWCVAGSKCKTYCDARNAIGTPKAAAPSSDVLVRCPAVRIGGFEPRYVARTNGTTAINIKVVGHRPLINGRRLEVTVAGRECTGFDPRVTDGQITCSVRAADAGSLRGPVRVVYVGDEGIARFVLQSDQSFGWVEPKVTGFGPMCGPASGGTELHVVGEYLDVAEVSVSVDGRAACNVTAATGDRVTCVTGPTTDAGGPLRVSFRGFPVVQLEPFEYAGLDAAQMFGCVASGGTRLTVRGRHLKCGRDLRLRTMGYGLTVHCWLSEDTHAHCPCPMLNSTDLSFELLAEFDDMPNPRLLTHKPLDLQVVPDPMFADFTVDGCCDVTLNGQHLDRGYALDDLNVTVVNSTAVGCHVTTVAADAISCHCPLQNNDTARVIAVTVGHNLNFTVAYNPKGAHLGHSMASVIMPSMVITLSVYVIIVVVLIVFLVCLKTTRKYDVFSKKNTTEMQSLNKRRNQPSDNAGADAESATPLKTTVVDK